MQLGGQLEGVECLLEEDGVEDLEGAAAGQRQQREVEAGVQFNRHLGFGVGFRDKLRSKFSTGELEV